ncbi:MAG: outer membrane protein [Bradyrhizobium sp.]
MKSLVLGAAIAAFGFAGSAITAPLNAPVYNWTGFYIGANAGGGWNSKSVNYTPNDDLMAAVFQVGAGPPSTRMSPFAIGGLQLGYNWQTSAHWVVGVETDLSLSSKVSVAKIITPPLGVPPYTSSAEQRIKWLSTVRGRVGFLPAPDLLMFVTGGLAVGEVQRSATSTGPVGAGFSATHSFSCLNGGTCFTGSSDTTSVGWTLGGGLEYALSRTWTLRGEYLYVRLSNPSVTETATAVFVAGLAPSSFGANFGGINIARMALNYRF